MNFYKIVYVLLFCSAVISNAAKVTFYENTYFRGENLTMEVLGLGCYDLPPNWKNKVSSVNTYDNCILVYEQSRCEERSVRIAPGTPSHNNLDNINLNDKISSFRQCPANENICRNTTVYVNTTQAPELEAFGQRVKKTLEDWYPSVCRMLYSPTYFEQNNMTVEFVLNAGVASAAWWNRKINGSIKYYKDHPNDIGSMIHEMAHIIEEYGSRDCPNWIVEGIADVARYQLFEPENSKKPDASKPCTAVYSNDSLFLRWMEKKWPNTIYWMNRLCRERKFDNERTFANLTGKNEQQLCDEWKQEW